MAIGAWQGKWKSQCHKENNTVNFEPASSSPNLNDIKVDFICGVTVATELVPRWPAGRQAITT